MENRINALALILCKLMCKWKMEIYKVSKCFSNTEIYCIIIWDYHFLWHHSISYTNSAKWLEISYASSLSACPSLPHSVWAVYSSTTWCLSCLSVWDVDNASPWLTIWKKKRRAWFTKHLHKCQMCTFFPKRNTTWNVQCSRWKDIKQG